jgi:hypothetical protein
LLTLVRGENLGSNSKCRLPECDSAMVLFPPHECIALKKNQKYLSQKNIRWRRGVV